MPITTNQTDKAIPFRLVDNLDNVTGLTGKASLISLQVAKPGGSFTSGGGSINEVGNGWYEYTPAANEVDTTGFVMLHVDDADAAAPVNLAVEVVSPKRGHISFNPLTFQAQDGDESLSVYFEFRTVSGVTRVDSDGQQGPLYEASDSAISNAGLSAGTYQVMARKGTVAGASSADAVLGASELPFEWDGSAELPQKSNVTNWRGNQPNTVDNNGNIPAKSSIGLIRGNP